MDDVEYTVWQMNGDGSKSLITDYPANTTNYAQVMSDIAALPTDSGQVYSLESWNGTIATVLF